MSTRGIRTKDRQYLRRRGTVPAVTAAAFHTPPETATQRSGRNPSSVRVSMTPTWKAHREAPPESTSPTRRAERRRSRAGGTS